MNFPQRISPSLFGVEIVNPEWYILFHSQAANKLTFSKQDQDGVYKNGLAGSRSRRILLKFAHRFVISIGINIRL